jgi:hypothetical protein
MKHVINLAKNKIKIYITEREWIDDAISIHHFDQDGDYPESFDEVPSYVLETIQSRESLTVSIRDSQFTGYPVSVTYSQGVDEEKGFISIDMMMA